MSWPFAPLRHFSYSAIAIDPPWEFETYSSKEQRRSIKGNRSADRHYDTMSIEEIAAMPVGHLASRHCILHLWVLSTLLDQGIRLMRHWGFQYKKIGFIWLKTTADGDPRMITGHWSRDEAEVCLLGTCGQPARLNADVRQTFRAPLREHSRKPDEFYRRVERLSAGPYADIFGRQQRPGWDVWGKESSKFGAVA